MGRSHTRRERALTRPLTLGLTLVLTGCAFQVRVAEPIAPPLPYPTAPRPGAADLAVLVGAGQWRDANQDWNAQVGFASSGLEIGLRGPLSLQLTGGGSAGAGHLLVWRGSVGPRFRPVRGLVVGAALTGQLGLYLNIPSLGTTAEVAYARQVGPVILAVALRGGISGRLRTPQAGAYVMPEIGVISVPTERVPLSGTISIAGHLGAPVTAESWSSSELRITFGLQARLPAPKR